MSKLYKYILPFIREESGRTTTISIVRLVTRNPAPTAEHQTKAIIQAVANWVKNSKDGQACWNDACDDLNIGDLSCYDKVFRKWLHKGEWSGLVLADIEFLWGGECADSMYFDRHLVEGV